MRAQRLDLGPWLPDQPPLDRQGCGVVKNAIPEIKSYRALRDLSPYTDALDSAAFAAHWAKDPSNTVSNFAGDAGKLYRLSGTNWLDVSKLGGYAASSWEFATFGFRVIAVAPEETPQSFIVGTDAVFSGLDAAAPAAKRIGIVRNLFVVLGNIPSLGSNWIQWSGYNNATIWGNPVVLAQAGAVPLQQQGGAVQKIVSGKQGIIFQEQAISLLTYQGPPTIFRLDNISRHKGTPAPNSVVSDGAVTFFYSNDGFYALSGGQLQPIGAHKVNRWLQANIADLESLYGAVDPEYQLVFWAFKSSAQAAQNDRVIIYNYAADRWSYGEVDTQLVASLLPTGFTLDDLDGPLPGGIDLDSIGVDSKAYQATGFPYLMAFDSANQAAIFSGTVLDALFETQEISDKGGDKLFLSDVRPLVDAFDATITVEDGVRDLQNAGYPAFGGAVALDEDGRAYLYSRARYHTIRMNFSGDFNHATGCEVRARRAGRR